VYLVSCALSRLTAQAARGHRLLLITGKVRQGLPDDEMEIHGHDHRYRIVHSVLVGTILTRPIIDKHAMR
jgi:hypothetical protein